MNQDLRIFYDLARRTRAKVLDWLETLPPEIFTKHNESFAYGSLAAIQSHTAATYLWWVGTVGLKKPERDVDASDVQSLRKVFADVDKTVHEALEHFGDLDAPLIWKSRTGEDVSLTQRWLILHPVTHEFHHKGQTLALARAIGHPHPGNPDADMVDP